MRFLFGWNLLEINKKQYDHQSFILKSTVVINDISNISKTRRPYDQEHG